MRNRRLLTLAVLAVAIGISASAQAGDANSPYGIAVLTVIQDPNALGTGKFTMNIRLWDDAGIGVTAQTPGLVDFAVKSIKGDGVGSLFVETVSIIAPQGEVDDGNSLFYGGGFSNKGELGIRYAGQNRSGTTPIPGNWCAVGYQPIAYGPKDANQNDLRDAAILYGMGTTGRTVGAAPQNNSVYPWASWTTDPNTFAGDTPIIYGEYSGSGGIAVETWGVDSFDCMPGTPSSVFTGPAVDANAFGRPVKAVIIQSTSDFGNDGGAAVAGNAMTWNLVVGDVVLGSNFKAGQQQGVGGALSTIANVTLNVDANGINTSVKLGAYQVLKNLNIDTAKAGNQKVDVAQYGVALYAGDAAALNAAEAAVIAAIETGVATSGAEGLVSSDPNVGATIASGPRSIGFARKTDAAALDYLEVKLVLTGDTNLDGFVDTTDRTTIITNWDPTGVVGGKKWYNGDLNMDGFVDTTDRTIIITNWNPTGTGAPGAAVPAPVAIPEPATLGLLALGALGLIRRRRA